MTRPIIGQIELDHYDQFLKINASFVHWLSPLTCEDLVTLLARCSYKRQIDNAQAVLIGYAHDVDYDHKNLQWLRPRFKSFFYIDRIIIDAEAQGLGYGRLLYEDFERQARARDLPRLVCEVNTKPENPGSHKFHLKMGFKPIGDVDYPDHDASLRYYEKKLKPD